MTLVFSNPVCRSVTCLLSTTLGLRRDTLLIVFLRWSDNFIRSLSVHPISPDCLWDHWKFEICVSHQDLYSDVEIRYRTTGNLVYHTNQVTQVPFTEVVGLSGSELMANFIYKLCLYTHTFLVSSASHFGDPGLNPVIYTMGKSTTIISTLC